MKIKKILKILGIIIAILIVLILIHTIRNYIIITDLQNKILQYSDSTNYHAKYITTDESKIIVTMDYYRKDNKEVIFLERNLNGEINKVSMYTNGEKTNVYTDAKDTKIAQLDTKTKIGINIFNQLETSNKWQTFIGSINTTVKPITYKEKDCYYISKFISSGTLTFEGAAMYIEKDTGLLVKTIEGKTVSEREQEFNNVDDSIFVEPDISQYTISE